MNASDPRPRAVSFRNSIVYQRHHQLYVGGIGGCPGGGCAVVGCRRLEEETVTELSSLNCHRGGHLMEECDYDRQVGRLLRLLCRSLHPGNGQFPPINEWMVWRGGGGAEYPLMVERVNSSR